MADSVAGILDNFGIRNLRSMRSGAHEEVICPRCDGGRTREKSLQVKIDDDGLGVVVRCWRGKCQWTAGERVRGEERHSRWDEPKAPPRKPAPQDDSEKPEWMYRFFADRHIGARTVEYFGCYSVTRNFQGLGKRPAIVFPYRLKGDVVNRKYRPHPDKQPQMQEANALPTLFNVDALGDEPKEIIWVEGEPDVMALHECGLTHAVTLKDGAGIAVSDTANPNDKRFAALRTHADLLVKAKRIVLAGDTDAPGLALREELARRLGRHRCFLATWPDGCKDACDTLIRDGLDTLVATIADARPYPIKGIYEIGPQPLLALRNRPPPPVLTTGVRATDEILKFPGDGRLIIVTGYAGHGKTSWARFVMIHTIKRHDRVWAVFSPEHQPWEYFAAECAEVYSGKPFWSVPGIDTMTDAEIADAGDWLNGRVTMMVCDAEDEAPTMDWVLERAAASVVRYGVTDLMLDPWNEIDQQRGDMSETDFVGKALQRFRAFAQRYGCNVWVIAHPAKPAPSKDRGDYMVPVGYSISGSQHWANKSDLGLTVHHEKDGAVGLYVWKSKSKRWSARGRRAVMDFEPASNRYRDPSDAEPIPPPPSWVTD